MSIHVLAFGDDYGIPQLIRHLPPGVLVGIVAAAIRPQQHAELARLAAAQGVPFLIQPRHTSPAYAAFVEQVGDLAPELILVNSYSMLIRPDVLRISRLGTVNIHGALLPEYRGANPMQWALLNGATETGVTMHHMTAECDAGDIIAQRRVPILFTDTWRDVLARIAEATEPLLSEELPRLLSGACPRQPQDESTARRYPRRRPEDGRIDWRWSVLHIYNLIRALVRPHPGAFYGDGPNRIVLDEYLTIPQVVALKYGPAGGQTLAAGSVCLSTPTLDDLPLLLGWLEDRQHPLTNGPFTCAQEPQRQSWFDAIQLRNDLVIFGIRPLGSDRFVGACRLEGIDYTERSAELTVQLGAMVQEFPECCTDATRLLLDFAFKDLDLHRVSARVPSSDLPTVRAYERVGFTREQVLRQEARADGHAADIFMMNMGRVKHAAA